MSRSEREVLEDAARVIAEQAAESGRIADEALAAGLDGSHPLTVKANMLRLHLLKVKADLERDLGLLVLDCTRCGSRVHYVAGLGASPGHWAHGEPARQTPHIFGFVNSGWLRGATKRSHRANAGRKETPATCSRLLAEGAGAHAPRGRLTSALGLAKHPRGEALRTPLPIPHTQGHQPRSWS